MTAIVFCGESVPGDRGGPPEACGERLPCSKHPTPCPNPGCSQGYVHDEFNTVRCPTCNPAKPYDTGHDQHGLPVGSLGKNKYAPQEVEIFTRESLHGDFAPDELSDEEHIEQIREFCSSTRGSSEVDLMIGIVHCETLLRIVDARAATPAPSEMALYDGLRESVVAICLESRTYEQGRQAAFLRDSLLTMIDPLMTITQRLKERAAKETK